MTQPSLDTADEVGYAGQCSSGEEGTVVKASREGLRETIVAFETAYYERDVDALLATVSANSGLAATEWEEVLPEAAPDDTSWCVVMQPEVDGVVDIDLEVTSPDGEVTTFRQRVAGEKVPGSSQWRIKKIDAQP
ncbi:MULTISPECIES: hypothetical protein [Corynebacterium]|uniref:hypothetical protein n=1 Tax=Corynebacterium TaxID=1716 RepID=UPI00124CA012|nr:MULTISPECIES: hypothetical protein [Corynebacterium]